jgi:hypothetical protein
MEDDDFDFNENIPPHEVLGDKVEISLPPLTSSGRHKRKLPLAEKGSGQKSSGSRRR